MFRQFLNESSSELKELNDILDDMADDEIRAFGVYLYNTFFIPDDDADEYFTRSDVDDMVQNLGTMFVPSLIHMLSFDDDRDYDDGVDDDGVDDDDGINEGVSRFMKSNNKNHKKRKFMANTKSDMRSTAQKRKRAARSNRANTKRYYRANKKQIAAYAKSRSSAIKNGTHKVKQRRVS